MSKTIDYLVESVAPVDQQYAVVEISTVRDIIAESKEGYFVKKFWENFTMSEVPHIESVEQFNLKSAKKENFYSDSSSFIKDFCKHLKDMDLGMKYEKYVEDNFPQLTSDYNKETKNLTNVVSFKIFRCFPTEEEAKEWINTEKKENEYMNKITLFVAPVGKYIAMDKRYEFFASNQEECLDGLNELKKRQRQQDTFRKLEFNARKSEQKKDMRELFDRVNKKNKEELLELNKKSGDDETMMKNEEETIKALKKMAGFDIEEDERYKNTRDVSDQMYWNQKDVEKDDYNKYTQQLYEKYQKQNPNNTLFEKTENNNNEKIETKETENYDEIYDLVH